MEHSVLAETKRNYVLSVSEMLCYTSTRGTDVKPASLLPSIQPPVMVRDLLVMLYTEVCG